MSLLEYSMPSGAFYFYVNIEKLKIDSSDLVKKLLKDTGVALTPGIDFDTVNGKKQLEFLFHPIRRAYFLDLSSSINGIKPTIETTTLVFFDHPFSLLRLLPFALAFLNFF